MAMSLKCLSVQTLKKQEWQNNYRKFPISGYIHALLTFSQQFSSLKLLWSMQTLSVATIKKRQLHTHMWVANNKYFQKATEIVYEEQDITKHNPLEEQFHTK